MILTVVFLDFKSQLLGEWIVFMTAFGMLIYWAVLNYLENPIRSHWLIERVPADWLTKDVDACFGHVEVKETSPDPVPVKEPFPTTP